MTEYNGSHRQTKMTGVASTPSPSSTSSTRSNGQSRQASTAGAAEPEISHKLPSTSNAATTDNKVLEPSSGSSLAQIAYQMFETVSSEAEKIVPPLQDMVPPLQEIIRGYAGEGLARLTQSTHNNLQLPYLQQDQLQSHQNPHQQGTFLEPIALRRHIHSTPQIRRASISALSAIHNKDDCDTDSDDDDPPPAGLEILDSTRSRSTPLTTSENSAFGTILRSNSHRVHDASSVTQATGCRSSAFSLPPYAMIKATSRSHSNERSARPVIFNPIVNEDEILKIGDGDDALGEMTSIEVTNVPYFKEEQEEVPQRHTKKKSGVASRAARFLTDVRNLRISSGNGSKRQNAGARYRPRDGRENPARPPSVSSDEQSLSSSVAAQSIRTNVRSDRNDLVQPGVVESSIGTPNNTSSEGNALSPDSTEKSDTETSSRNDRVCIEVNDNVDFDNRHSYSVSSPESLAQSFVSHIQDSPDSGRSLPSISNVSGRRSQETSASNSSNSRSLGSQLSAISETDREVANVNLLQRDRRLQVVGEQIELSLSSDRTIESGDMNFSLSTATPESRTRGDGASVQADRFFNYSKDSSRFRNMRPFLKRSGLAQSPTTGSCAASVNTNSSTGSDEPPNIVSCMPKQVSDLSSLHRPLSLETSSPRADHDQEVREASPSGQIQAEDSEIVFEGAHVAKIDIYNKPRQRSHVAISRNIRSLPPRSPGNKLFSSTTSTPPPGGGSPAYGISPPRHIIGHRVDPMSTSLSKPHVVAPISSRFNPTHSTELLHAPNQGYREVVQLSPTCDYYNLKPAARGLSPVCGHQDTRAYKESSIEILKTDSKDDNSIPLVTPDKGTPSP
mmetsp:Transcript_11291/g.22331  ORF Transcript_11291/g.22331 Transcript_11291/m.22331 type:complete len:844 (+) Transcript_11291:257-2788(+)